MHDVNVSIFMLLSHSGRHSLCQQAIGVRS